MHNAQKSSDWTNSSRAIKRFKKSKFQDYNVDFFFIKNVKIFFL
jgi:hypothetical protein